MLLITNMMVDNDTVAKLVYVLYLQRSKIEAIFKFCKDVLNWEAPRIPDFECMKNTLAFVFFLAGYFYEIEYELRHNPNLLS